MAENSKIEWTHHTFNPWIGCMKVSPGCDHCYAETQNNHRQWNPGGWTPGAERKRTSAAYWRQPFKWDREAAAAGERRRVFCASLADVFDNQLPDEWRDDLWSLIAKTPNLDWLLLTKRPQNIANMLPVPFDFEKLYPNVWLGTTVENQEEADRRIPHLLSVPARVRFLSCEPLLGPVDLRHVALANGYASNVLEGYRHDFGVPMSDLPGKVNWVICGGESGKGARPMHPDWARSLRDQCKAAGVAFFMKQWGEYRAAAPAYADEDPVWKHEAVKSAFGPEANPDLCDVDVADGFLDYCRDFPDLGVLYRDGHFYDGETWQPHVKRGCYWMERVGKARAGRLLDGVTHDEFPQPI